MVGLRVVSSARNTSISRLLSVSSMKSNALLMRLPAASTKGEIFETSALYARSMAWNATSPSVAFSSMHCAAKALLVKIDDQALLANELRDAVPDSIFLASLRSRSTREGQAPRRRSHLRGTRPSSRAASHVASQLAPSRSSAFEQSADSVSIIRPRRQCARRRALLRAIFLMDGVAAPERMTPPG